MDFRAYRTIGECTTQFEREIVRDVETTGHALVRGLLLEGNFVDVQTVGLEHSFEHPELAVLGLPPATAEGLLEGLVSMIQRGRRFHAGQVCSDLPIRVPQLRFEQIARREYEEHLSTACWFYGSTEFRALQVVWPDWNLRFPDDPLFAESLACQQPYLGAP